MKNEIRSKQELQRDLWKSQNKKTRKKIINEETRVRDVAGRIPGIIFQFVRSSSGIFSVTYICERAQPMLGLEPEDIMSDPSVLMNLVKQDEADTIQRGIRESAETLEIVSRDLEIKKADGKGIWLRVEAVPHRLPNRDTMWNGIALDISERKKTEEELLKTKEALVKAGHELEDRVRERTAELMEVNKRLSRQMKERRRMEQELLQIRSRLLYAHEEEQKRIACELHDGIGQILTAAKMKAETAVLEMHKSCPEKTRRLVEDLSPLLQRTIQELYKISKNLRPLTLEHLGVLYTIENISREVGEIMGVPVETDLTVDEIEIPEILGIVMVRVLQEGLNNIMKHSKAAHIRVALKTSNDSFDFSICDDGIGCDLENMLSERQPAQRMGIESMKERVRLSGGKFSIQSTLGGGTTVRAVWPRKAPALGKPKGTACHQGTKKP